jgi:hypothetical protein
MLKRVLVVMFAMMLSSSVAFADTYRDAHRLGGSTSFYKRLTNRASVKVFITTKGQAADVRRALTEAGVPELSDSVIETLTNGTSAGSVGSCSDVQLEEGQIAECRFQKGTTLEWMAYRPNIHKHDRTPGLIRKFRWGGKKPFEAFTFVVVRDHKHYVFVLPKDCGNLALKSVTEEKVVEVAPPAPVVVEKCDCPPPPAPEVITKEVQVPVEVVKTVEVAKKRHMRFFAQGDFGKDRRVREKEYGSGTFAQCTPFLMARLGNLYKWDNGWEVGGAVGTTYPLVDAKKKAKQEEVFADLEVNRYFGNAYVGGGVSFWDISRTRATRQGSYTPALLTHFGIPVGLGDRVQISLEDRIFLKKQYRDDISNNYQIAAGVRVKF